MKSSIAANILRQAARWLVQLDESATEADRQAFAAWLAADPQHLLAVQSLQNSITALHSLPRGPARAALTHAAHTSRRSSIAKALLVVLSFSVPLGLLWQQYPTGYLLADLRTDTGQWRSETLPDGSRIMLDGRSAVDLHFDASARTLRLVQGEVLVSVAKDAQRPFVVETAHGQIRALGTRFVVEQDSEGTRLAMMESSTEVRSNGHGAVVHAGQQVRLDAHGLTPVEPVDADAHERAWAKHQIVIDRQPLGRVLERLNRNRSGYLIYDRDALNRIEVTAVLPEEEDGNALQLLARSLPIHVQQYGPWIARITLKPHR